MYTEQITFLQIKNLLDQWSEESGVYLDEPMHFPYDPEKSGSQAQVLWGLVSTGRVNTVRGLKGRYDRFVLAVKSR